MQDDNLLHSAEARNQNAAQKKSSGRFQLIFFIALGVAGFAFLFVAGHIHGPWAGATPVMLGLLAYPAFPRRIDFEAFESDRHDPDQDFPLTPLLENIFHGANEAVNARAATFTFRDAETGQHFSGRLQRQCPRVQFFQAKRFQHFRWWRSAWRGASIVKTANGPKSAGLDWNSKELRELPNPVNLSSIWDEAFERLLIVKLLPDRRWSGYIVFCDAEFPKEDLAALLTLRQIVEVAVRGYEMRAEACEQARAEERLRIARDLHDGVMQSLSVSAMQMEGIRRRNIDEMNAETAKALADAQELLTAEIRKLRMQADQLRSGLLSEPLLPYLTELIKEFEREAGISTVFTYDINASIISPKLMLDLVYMVREGLSNVRKHSQSGRVEVSLTGEHAVCLTIQDFGCGFDFSGVRSIREMGRRRQGPRVLRERVAANGGKLLVESCPEHGTRLTINLPVAGKQSNHACSSENCDQPTVADLRTPLYRKGPESIYVERRRYFRKK